MAEAEDESDTPHGPYIVWEDFGYEGWSPTSYATLREAVGHVKFTENYVLTKLVQFDVKEIE